MKNLNILITNDDGIEANGINVTAEVMREFGNVTVVAPAGPQSGMSAAISLMKQLRLKKIDESPVTETLGSLKRYSFTGTPTDCAKMGMSLLSQEGIIPDYLVSGLNHGTNSSVAAVYSGTLGAAKEGAIYDVPSIAFSYTEFDHDADLTTPKYFERIIMKMAMEVGVKTGTYWNVNIPGLPIKDVKGIMVTIQGRGRWIREFDFISEENDETIFTMLGDFIDLSGFGPENDHIANINGYVSLTPLKIDSTDYQEVDRLNEILSHKR